MRRVSGCAQLERGPAELDDVVGHGVDDGRDRRQTLEERGVVGVEVMVRHQAPPSVSKV